MKKTNTLLAFVVLFYGLCHLAAAQSTSSSNTYLGDQPGDPPAPRMLPVGRMPFHPVSYENSYPTGAAPTIPVEDGGIYCDQSLIARCTVTRTEGEKVGLEEGYTMVEGWFPLDQQAGFNVSFAEFTVQAFDDFSRAANFSAGLGHRVYSQSSDKVYGSHVYYNFRETGQVIFNEVGVGLEAIGSYWETRANGSFIIGNDRVFLNRAASRFQGNLIIFDESYENAFSLIECEIGRTVVRDCGAGLTIKGFIGGYGLYNESERDVWGFSSRWQFTVRDIFFANLTMQRDPVFDSTVGIQLGLNFGGNRRRQSCGKGSCDASERLGARVERNRYVIIERDREQAVANDPTTGLPIAVTHVNSGAGGDNLGTFEDPFTALTSASGSTSNIVYLHAGSTFNGQQLNVSTAGQRVLGDGDKATHQFTSQFGTAALPAGSGLVPAPILLAAAGTTVSISANDVEVAGIEFDDTAGAGFQIIQAQNVSGLNIHDNCFVGDPVSTIAILADELTGTNVFSNNLFDLVLTGIDILNSTTSGGVTIDNNTFDATGSTSIIANAIGLGSVLNVAVTNNTMLNGTGGAGGDELNVTAGDGGILSLLATDNTITDSTAEAFDVTAFNGGFITASLNTNTVSGTTTAINAISNGSGLVSIGVVDNTITNGSANFITNGGADLLFARVTGNTIVGAGSFDYNENGGLMGLETGTIAPGADTIDGATIQNVSDNNGNTGTATIISGNIDSLTPGSIVLP